MSGERATSQSTIETLLDNSRRDHLPLAKTFVQHRDKDDRGVPGPLAGFVSAHHERALQQYTLAHAAASGGEWDVTYDSRVWARALGLSEKHASSQNAISRNWRWLENARLLERSRSGRMSRITLLYDDGSGDPYEHPSARKEKYLRLPYAFWREEWHRALDLSAIAVLLIGLHEKPGWFELVAERVPEWYGISVSSFSKGFQTLRRRNLIERRRDQVAAPLAPLGYTFKYSYRLTGTFERPAEKAAKN
ncbi:MAG TPA: hypothetical protein VIL53_00180 [Solirubrobacterales bacterium]|jgi:hypothetical protein